MTETWHGSVLGRWELVLSTPIGRLPAVLDLVREGDGLGGTATARDEQVPLQDVTADQTPEGVRLRWRQTVTTPMRLTLTFDVLATDHSMIGESRAGRLPRTKVTGHRTTP